MIYKDPKNVLQMKLNEALGRQEETMVTDLLKLSFLKKASKDKDALLLTEIYNLLGLEKFTDLINLLDGRPLELPSKEEFKDTIITVLSYYYRDVEHLEWSEIKQKISDDINPVRYGIKASQFGSFLEELINKRLK